MYLDEYGIGYRVTLIQRHNSNFIDGVTYVESMELFYDANQVIHFLNSQKAFNYNIMRLVVFEHGVRKYNYEFVRLTGFKFLLKLAVRFTIWVEGNVP